MTKTKNEILKEYGKYKKENEEILDVFKQKRKNSNKTDWWMTIKCLKHDYVFNIRCSNYKRGQGCKKCGQDRTVSSCLLSHQQVENDFKKYLKPNEEIIKIYKKNRINGVPEWWATIECNKHGIFEISKAHHKSGKGCPKCGKDRKKEKLTLTPQQVENDFKKHLKPNEEIIKIYNKKDGNNHNIWYATLKCKYHGEFDISKSNHMSNCGCPKCSSSKGEKKIREYLLSNNIDFEEQYKFEDCKNRNSLPFDFYLPNKNICIEYQGIQHYKSIDFFGGEEGFLYRQQNDKIKKEYCQKNNIKLLEISYIDYNNIEDILKTNLQG